MLKERKNYLTATLLLPQLIPIRMMISHSQVIWQGWQTIEYSLRFNKCRRICKLRKKGKCLLVHRILITHRNNQVKRNNKWFLRERIPKKHLKHLNRRRMANKISQRVMHQVLRLVIIRKANKRLIVSSKTHKTSKEPQIAPMLSGKISMITTRMNQMERM